MSQAVVDHVEYLLEASTRVDVNIKVIREQVVFECDSREKTATATAQLGVNLLDHGGLLSQQAEVSVEWTGVDGEKKIESESISGMSRAR